MSGSKPLDFLPPKILLRINREQIKKDKLWRVTSRIICSFSFFALFPIIIDVLTKLKNSGFWNYLSLLSTDTGAVAMYWREFSLSLVDALPLFQLTLIFALLLVMFASFRFALKDFKRIGLSANLA